jgi:hypothetical protein
MRWAWLYILAVLSILLLGMANDFDHRPKPFTERVDR